MIQTGYEGWTLLTYAASFNTNPDIIKALIECGAYVNDRSNEDQTPLMYATSYSTEPAIIKVLVDAGAYVNARQLKSGMTPLMFAAQYNSNFDVLNMLLDNGADVKATDNLGNTALSHLKDNKAINNTVEYQRICDLLQ